MAKHRMDLLRPVNAAQHRTCTNILRPSYLPTDDLRSTKTGAEFESVRLAIAQPKSSPPLSPSFSPSSLKSLEYHLSTSLLSLSLSLFFSTVTTLVDLTGSSDLVWFDLILVFESERLGGPVSLSC